MIADERSVRDFLEAFVGLAIASLGGYPPPGVLQTSRKFPDDDDLVPSRYALDHADVVERMTRDALCDSEAGANVYIEGRLIKPGLRGKKRGELSDTACVFALAVDSDADKNMAWIPPMGVRPTLIVETSPGNHQFWFVFREHAQSQPRTRPRRRFGEGLRKRSLRC